MHGIYLELSERQQLVDDLEFDLTEWLEKRHALARDPSKAEELKAADERIGVIEKEIAKYKKGLL